jgi:hypothetical protein
MEKSAYQNVDEKAIQNERGLCEQDFCGFRHFRHLMHGSRLTQFIFMQCRDNSQVRLITVCSEIKHALSTRRASFVNHVAARKFQPMRQGPLTVRMEDPDLYLPNRSTQNLEQLSKSSRCSHPVQR